LKRLLLAVLLSITVLVISPATVCFADQADPDSTPTVEIDMYRNLLETGDVLCLIYTNIPYAAAPDANVEEAFIWRLIDTDNVTELGSTIGYAYNDDGYGYNVFAMYFSAADALVWESDYIVRLSGNPAIFVTPPEYNWAVDVSDYSSLIASADVRAALAARILLISTDIDKRWGLGAALSLLMETETGTVLSEYGEAFLRGAIYGLQALCPTIFRFSVGNIEVTDRTWSDEYAENLTGMYAGTWVQTAKDAGATLAGTSYDWMTILLIVGMGIAAIFAGMSLSGGDAWAGMVDGGIVLLGGARLAFFDLAFMGLIVALCWMYISAKIWGFIR